MLVLMGFIIVCASVLGGYVLAHGVLAALWQPYELIIILGAALGSFLISNPWHTIVVVTKSIPSIFKGNRFNRAYFMDLLSLVHDLLSVWRRDGIMAIEAEIEDPDDSELFDQYPRVKATPEVVEFLCDYLRIVSSSNMAPHELENLMDIEIETTQHEYEAPATAINKVADSLPGFGIVAAVLGIVITMKSLGGPPEALGAHVAAALVGTFLGVLFAYGFVGPMAVALEHRANTRIKAQEVIKISILAMFNGIPPQMAVEFGRKALYREERPSFHELEEHVRSC